ncbi:aminodeoxychorismate synthase component I [Methylocucumis oryzae]|uniref:aminodeoxychorismate synthase n=1 Tax=Methylocucumis oryzae TaxID=1632867 RepID=A0A0F3IK59_9GAMM|nr:aminodeoxychorismate synthase component I [Methylocucumis oryzae]KJV07110.1 aminodeoxychorismate synthase [Methylocucumis oryzae]
MPEPTFFLTELPYCADSSTLFAVLADDEWSVFLDSGYPDCQQGRYDIMAAEPVATLVTRGNNTEIKRGELCLCSEDDPFTLVKQELALWSPSQSVKQPDLPFTGGAIGYFAYDLARRLEKLPVIALDAEHIPDMAVGIYQWAIIVDHQLQKAFWLDYGLTSERRAQLLPRFSQTLTPCATKPFTVLSKVRCNFDKTSYAQAFHCIKHYLTEGDCYQVNLTQRFEADCAGHPWSAYALLRKLNPAPFSAYLNLADVQVLSSSPERFLLVTDNTVETKPIKGTKPRKADPVQDDEQATLLQNSPKDRAENLMIVDLLRNDLGKTCALGSIKVPHLFAIESYATVHHLVSTVTGELAENTHAVDVLKSCFPGGSITGAPKLRSMEVIEELETHRRGVYCGAIGYIGFNGVMDTNIAIRTLVHSSASIRFWVGGGIVHDSILDDEYQECFDKASALLNLLNQLTP